MTVGDRAAWHIEVYQIRQAHRFIGSLAAPYLDLTPSQWKSSRAYGETGRRGCHHSFVSLFNSFRTLSSTPSCSLLNASQCRWTMPSSNNNSGETLQISINV